MERSPLVTIIVPVYNVAPYLERCVDSLIAQTWRKLEILLVDDGSTDVPAAFATDMRKQTPESV